MRKATVLAALLSLVAPLATGRAQEGSAPAAFRVIIHPTQPISSVEQKFLAEAFLKKVTRWPDGSPIRPVDSGAASPIRRRFSHEVLGRSVPAVKSYWQQLIFSGRDTPPPELNGDEEVVAFVTSHPGAVGYVSGTAQLGGAKVLSIR